MKKKYSAKFGPISVGLAIAVVVGMTGCGSTPAGDGKASPFRVVFIGGQTGPGSATAMDAIAGLKAGARDVNAEGGINGREVKIDVLDSKADPTQAVTQLQRLINSGEPVDLVYAATSSSEALAMLPILSENKILSVSQASSDQVNNPAAYPFHFGVSPSNSEAHRIVADQFKGKRTVGLLVPTTAFGDSLIKTVGAIVQEQGAQVVATERFDPTDVDYTVQYQRVLASHPDVIFADAVGSDLVGRIFEARRLAGGMDVPLVVGFGAAASVPAKAAPAGSTNNCVLPTFTYTVKDKGNSKTLGTLVEAAKDAKTGVVNMLGYGYDFLHILKYVADDTHATDADTVKTFLEKNRMPSGLLDVYPDGMAYTPQNHFATVSEGTMLLLPCEAKVSDGFWSAP